MCEYDEVAQFRIHLFLTLSLSSVQSLHIQEQNYVAPLA